MSGQIDQLVEQVRAFPDARIRDTALELAQAILDLHAGALARLLALLPHASEDGEALIVRLADDPKIGGVLLLHDLHPLDLATRVKRALARPELHSGGAKIELISSEEGIVRARVEGPRDLRAIIEQAIWDAAPDARQVMVEGTGESTRAGFVPLEHLLAGSP